MTTELFICTWKGVISAKPGDGQWTVDKEALTSWGIFDLAISPNASKRMFAGTRGDGVWVSDDLGETWRLPNRGKPGPGKVRGLAIDPNDPDKIYAGTEPIALWVSEDAGENWRKLDSVWDDIPGLDQLTYPGKVIEPHVRDITIHPRGFQHDLCLASGRFHDQEHRWRCNMESAEQGCGRRYSYHRPPRR